MSVNKWFLTPSKKQFMIIGSIWSLGIILLILATTNFFAESIFQQKNTLTNILILSSILGIFSYYVRYRRNQK